MIRLHTVFTLQYSDLYYSRLSKATYITIIICIVIYAIYEKSFKGGKF